MRRLAALLAATAALAAPAAAAAMTQDDAVTAATTYAYSRCGQIVLGPFNIPIVWIQCNGVMRAQCTNTGINQVGAVQWLCGATVFQTNRITGTSQQCDVVSMYQPDKTRVYGAKVCYNTSPES